MTSILLSQAVDEAHDAGFEEGSLVACNAILLFLISQNEGALAARMRSAWDDGIIGSDWAALQALDQAKRRALESEAARGQGFTGDECPKCSSMKMVHTGHCNTCQSCGETTGCS